MKKILSLVLLTVLVIFASAAFAGENEAPETDTCCCGGETEGCSGDCTDCECGEDCECGGECQCDGDCDGECSCENCTCEEETPEEVPEETGCSGCGGCHQQ